MLGTFFLDIGTFVPNRDTDHQAAYPGVVFCKTLAEPLTFADYFGKERFENTDRRKACSTGYRTACKRAPMFTFRKLKTVTGNKGTHGKPACDAFCKGDNIWLYFSMLDRKPFSGSSHTRLNFINYHECPGRVTDFADPLKETVPRNDNPGFTLYGFDYYGCG